MTMIQLQLRWMDLSYLLKTVFFLSLALMLLASSIIKDNFMASHCGDAVTQKENTFDN